MSESVIDERVEMKDIMDQVMAYLIDKIPTYATWSKKNLRDHISFYSNGGRLFVHQDSQGKIDGVLALQLIDTTDDARYEVHKEEGDGVHVRILAADNQLAKADLIRQGMMLTGIKSWVSFERAKYSDRLRKLPWALAERIACYGR